MYLSKRRRVAQNKPFACNLTPLPAATTFVNGVHELTEKGDEMDGEKGYIKTSLISIMNSELKTQHNIERESAGSDPIPHLSP